MCEFNIFFNEILILFGEFEYEKWINKNIR